MCDIHTPYCPISSPLSTHHNCQYLVRYEAEKEERGRRRALQMDITAVEHGKVDLALPLGSLKYLRLTTWYVVNVCFDNVNPIKSVFF